MLKLIMTVGVGLIRAKNTEWDVRRGLCYTYATQDERMGDIGILRKYMYFAVFGGDRYAIQKIKTGMRG